MREIREQLLSDQTLTGLELCQRLSAATDRWLRELFESAVGETRPVGLALVAVGGYGRGELSPRSDLDVLLVHDPGVDVSKVAEGIWYPIWDAGLKLGHSVRTVDEAVRLADDDLDTATSLLDCRLIAGTPELAARRRPRARVGWQRGARRRLLELARSVEERHAQAGEVAFVLEPDLKEGRGGLRDVHALRWARAARSVLLDDLEDLDRHYAVLLAARVELHRRTGRPGDVLLLEEQDAVAAALGDPDADALMRRIATAARAIAWQSDETWRRIESSLRGPLGRFAGRELKLGGGLVQRDGFIALGPDADLTDPVLPLRAAAVAASHGTTLEPTSFAQLATVPPLPEPWPPEARARFVELLLAGRQAIGVVESLDHHGLWVRFLPEWEVVHCAPQRNAYHTFTVDRHLLEAAANAAGLLDRVDRPDLLVVGALLHDIGKARPGDHTEIGMELIATIATRMGFSPADTEILVQMVRHHLLLPDVATRRDLTDEGTLRHVADAVGSVRVLRLLDALTEADSLATGPAAWGDWKAGLVRELVARTSHLLAGGDLSEVLPDDFPSAAERELMAAGGRHVLTTDHTLTVVDDDRPGLFSHVSGALAVNGIQVLGASAWSDDGRAINAFLVASATGDPIPWERVRADLDAALDGTLDVEARLERRATSIRQARPRAAHQPATRVVVDNDLSRVATVIEVHTADRPGVLHRLTSALADQGLDIRSARVQTLGPTVVDSFYVLDRDGAKLADRARVREVEEAVCAALDGRDESRGRDRSPLT
jgi:[protein-PII] uridylyltransferase